jgi:GxxExxY protein
MATQIHESIELEVGFRADVIIDKTLLIEFKSVEALTNIHFKQVQTY